MKVNQYQALAWLKPTEGRYTNNPSDNGGPTNMGITLTTFKRFIKHDGTVADLKRLTWDQASIVYITNYWNPCQCDKLPNGVDNVVFDMSVNSGPKKSVEILQKSLGSLYTGIVDGLIGPKTLQAAQMMDPTDLIAAFSDHRLAYLKSLDDWGVFGKGWSNRVTRVRTQSLSLTKHTGV